MGPTLPSVGPMVLIKGICWVAGHALTISTLTAAFRRTTTLRIPTGKVPHPLARQYLEQYLEIGEGIAEKSTEAMKGFAKAHEELPFGSALEKGIGDAYKTGWRLPEDAVRSAACKSK